MAITLKSLAHKTAVITGGSGGIGLALAHMAAEQGAHVWLLARRDALLAEARAALAHHAGSADFIVADVANWHQVKQAMARIEAKTGAPDLVVNTAGITHPGYVHEIPVEIYREVVDINYMGTVHVVQADLPGMLARGSGYIVNFSSVAGYVTGPGYGAYSPSKYAVRGYSDVLRTELKPRGVGVSIVFPPDTDTAQLAHERRLKTPELRHLQDNAGLGPLRFGVLSPEQVARDTLRGISRGRYTILPGRVNALLYRFVGIAGDLVLPITDGEWATARRKHGRS